VSSRFLLPPDVRDWLPANRLASFVIDAVAAVDLDAFYAAYRVDGRSRPPYRVGVAGLEAAGVADGR
jgi:hypothetical protein